MKKIAYLVPVFPVASETFITTEIKALQQQGYDVQLICLERSSQPCLQGDEAILEQSLSVEEVPLNQLFSTTLWLIFKTFFSTLLMAKKRASFISGLRFLFAQQGVRPRSLFLQALKIIHLVQQTGCRHIHAHFGWAPASNGIVAARLSGLRISFTCHGSDVYKTPQDLQIKLQNADFVVAVCKRMYKQFRQLAPQTAIVHLPCGVDTQLFCAEEQGSVQSNEAQANSAADLRFLFLGRLSETKGVDYLIQALAQLPEEKRVVIDIAGDGPMSQELRALADQHQLGRWLNFIGRVDRRWVTEKLKHYHAVVLPFCKTAEGIMDTGPLTLKEAMACQVPIVTTDIMADGEILDGASAWVCRHNDAEDLAATLSQLIDQLMQSNSESSVIQSDSVHPSLQRRIDLAYRKVTNDFDALLLARRLGQWFDAEAPASERKEHHYGV